MICAAMTKSRGVIAMTSENKKREAILKAQEVGPLA